MKVQVPIIAAIGQAVLGSMLETQDSSLTIPATLVPTFDAQLPTIVGTSTAVFYPTSFLCSSIISRNNQVAATNTMCSLEKGVWQLEFNCSSRFNYTETGFVSALQISLFIGLFQVPLYHRFSSVGAFNDSIIRQVVLTERATVLHAVAATGAADFLETMISLNAVKRL